MIDDGSTPLQRPAPTLIERVVWPIAAAAIIGIFVVWSLNPPSGLRGRARLGPPLAGTLVVLCSGLYIAGWARTRNLARAKRLGFRVCPRCRRDLTHEADAGRCPRCGFAYDAEYLRAIWTNLGPAAPGSRGSAGPTQRP